VKQSVAAYEASKYEWQQSKDKLVLDVILAYLQVLNNEDLLKSAMNQAEVSRRQVERAEIMDKQGAVKPSDLSDYRGQLMNDQLAIVNSHNALETARLMLQQLMNRPYDRNMQIQRLDVGELLEAYTNTPDNIYQTALEQFSLIRAAEARNKSYYYGLKSARGYLYPYLYLGGGLSTTYSSTAQSATGKIPYNSQLINNVGSGVFVGLSIPIFNHMLFRNRIKLAEIALKNSELNEQNTKIQLHQDIEQSYLNMTNAYERYKVLQDQVNAYTESFKAAEVRFNSGVGTSIDYLTAKDRLDRANINLINARYDFVLRKKILDYYTNSMH
jgi:outer membrane protein